MVQFRAEGLGLQPANPSILKPRQGVPMPRKKNTTPIQPDDKFNRWTVLSFAVNNNGNPKWLCRCDCGNERIIPASTLRSSKSKSCGCFRRDTNLTHGYYKHPTYKTWCMMITRCTNPRYSKYSFYGGRGITVHESWLKFDAFLADVGLRPKGTTLDRVDNNGNYEPGNVRWATKAEQMRNTRSTHFITFNNETMCATDWAARLGITNRAMFHRLRRWPLDRVMAGIPLQLRRPRALRG